IEDRPEDKFDFIYDQIVSIGEFLSSIIISHYLNDQGIANSWLDVRDVLKTDNSYREGGVKWKESEQLVKAKVPAMLSKGMVVTQGFIGCTSENYTTTLGREGS